MIHSLERAMNAALDEDPGDAVTRLQLADLLLDLGRDEEAEGQRWLVEVGKWPTYRRHLPYLHSDPLRPWDWWGSDDPECSVVAGPPHARPPSGFWDRDWQDAEAGNGRYRRRNGRYRRRIDAEGALIAYARRKNLIKGATA